jgi:hypothetical protein
MSRAIRDGRAHRLHQGASESVSEPEWEVAFSPEDVDQVAALVHAKFCADLKGILFGVFPELAQEEQETFRGLVLAVMDAMATVAVEKRNVRRDRSGHD